MGLNEVLKTQNLIFLFTLLLPESLILKENITASRLMQYYVGVNSASKKNPYHIIELGVNVTIKKDYKNLLLLIASYEETSFCSA